MAATVTIDLRHVARGLGVTLQQVQATAELLDDGNTVPFITRYRKDQTGGLDEEQVREIQDRLAKARLLAERKQAILRSVESQGKLTDELARQILAAPTTKRLEDLYLPFRPKKQTLATAARTRGLEPLAREILEADPLCADLDARAADFVSSDRRVTSPADALLGAGHILAEQFSERPDLRQRLREILQRSGRLVSTQVAAEGPGDRDSGLAAASTRPPAEEEAAAVGEAAPPASEVVHAEATPSEPSGEPATEPEQPTEPAAEPEHPAAEPATEPEHPAVEPAAETPHPIQAPDTPDSPPAAESAQTPETAVAVPAAASPPPERRLSAAARAKAARQEKREQKKKKEEERKIKAFRDFFNYREEVRKIPPHRILAINRGERARVLRVKLEVDQRAMEAAVDEMLVPEGHPHADYLRGCARDALTRLILPSLDRELRRELTERAEAHAVEVFAKNLRNLLLQPPVRGRRVLAIDPGFKSGCKLVALDQFGNVLGHDVIFLVGKPDRRDEARQKVLDLVGKYDCTVIAVGNGTACRPTEDFVAELIERDLKDRGVRYAIVNEAGASVYSTSRVGREEFPNYDASLRGAISIGRRLEDPLSELVKIDPANIGVGLYQHDVKVKHLRESLDEVVASCVNYVGVDVNTASPELLRYVSGLNQLTARRIFEHRRQRGPFRSREELREVPGFGEATFVQAAGFLKIAGGHNPLDATWIHPESYETASRLLEKLECTPADLTDKEKTASLAGRIVAADREALAADLHVGRHTLDGILASLARPGRDPREGLPGPVFRQDVLKFEDLSPGMELTGTVANVVDFGAFVDIGMHDSGLVHVSQLADRFIRDPHEFLAVGDVVKVWVKEVDKQRRRVSLTMIPPGREKPRGPRRDEKPEGDQADGAPRRGRRGGGGRPPARPGAPGGPPAAAAEGAARPPAARPPQDRPPRDRPPRGGDRDRKRYDRPPRGGGGGGPRHYEPRPRPKPITPITDEMKEGKEPMRTFGDLLQFYQAKQGEPPPRDEPKKPKPKERKDSERPAPDVPPRATPTDAPPPAPPTDAAPLAGPPSDLLPPEAPPPEPPAVAEAPKQPSVPEEAAPSPEPTQEPNA